MAKRRRKSSSKDCPEPLNTLIDLAGAAALGAFAKYKVKRDYAKGEGAASIKGATMYYSMGTLRRGSAGSLALGGLLGVRSAVKDIEKEERARRLRAPVYDNGIDLSFYRTHDNRYAWRLNCEDGSGYGIDPENYETRDAYHEALRKAKADFGEMDETGAYEQSDRETSQTRAAAPGRTRGVSFCQVSLLSNGKTETFWTDDRTIKRGDIVVVSIGHYSPGAYPRPLEDTKEIIGQAK